MAVMPTEIEAMRSAVQKRKNIHIIVIHCVAIIERFKYSRFSESMNMHTHWNIDVTFS